MSVTPRLRASSVSSWKIDCKGQLLYNSGVIFFKNSPKARSVLECWKKLALRYENKSPHDQPFLTLAMEVLGFNPYSLTISYNYRGRGNAISGPVRIWHHRGDVPADINEHHDVWPPRRAWPKGVVYRRLKYKLLHDSLRDKIARVMKRTR